MWIRTVNGLRFVEAVKHPYSNLYFWIPKSQLEYYQNLNNYGKDKV